MLKDIYIQATLTTVNYMKNIENQDNEINKGGTVKGVKMYKLKDTKTPVTLEVKDQTDFIKIRRKRN